MEASFDYVSLYLQNAGKGITQACPRPGKSITQTAPGLIYVFSMLSPKLSDLFSWEKELRMAIGLASVWVWHVSVHMPPALSHKVL